MKTLIAAVGKGGVIGGNGALLWNIPEDLARFKELTMGKNVVMGRKTWESLPKHPLSNRKNVVITRDLLYNADGATVVHDIKSAFDVVEGDAFVIGGAQIYEQAMPYVDGMYITQVHYSYPFADAFFPTIDFDQWNLVSMNKFCKRTDFLLERVDK